MNRRELLKRLSAGNFHNVAFRDMLSLLEGFGFVEARRKGSHRIYRHPQIPELLNVQDAQGLAKPYQIRQALGLIERHGLRLEDER